LKNKSVGSAEQVFSEYDEPLYKKSLDISFFIKIMMMRNLRFLLKPLKMEIKNSLF